jgi:16S rRNA (uracil1498-N3)-methyltransferase
MKQFLLPVSPDANGSVRLRGEDYHYLVRVRRLRVGDSFPAQLPVQEDGLDPGRNGTKTLVQILSVDGETLVGRCQLLEEAGPVESSPPILLFQALPKGAKMDLIIRQAVELGVTGIVPFAAERSIPRLPEGDGKFERWERIIREARQQSGSATPTSLCGPLDMEGLLSYWEALKNRYSRPLGLLFHQDPVNPLARATLHDYLSKKTDIIVLGIGPEGGFSPGEVSRFLEAGFKPFKFGNTVLRTETAALCGVAAVSIILLENISWIHKPQ